MVFEDDKTGRGKRRGNERCGMMVWLEMGWKSSTNGLSFMDIVAKEVDQLAQRHSKWPL